MRTARLLQVSPSMPCSGGKGLPQCMLGYHPPGADTSPPHAQDQTPMGPGTPPREQNHRHV